MSHPEASVSASAAPDARGGSPRLTVLWADPEALVIEQSDFVWILSGISASEAARLRGREPSSGGLEADICKRAGDAVVLKVHLGESKARQVEVWKGMTSAYEVFYALRRNSDVLISDNFRSILSRLPVSERQTSETALVDHFLFRRVGGTESYCQGIARPGHGERLTLDLAAGVANKIQFDRVSDVSVTESTAYQCPRT